MGAGLLCLVVAFFSWSCTEDSPPTPRPTLARPAATAAPTPTPLALAPATPVATASPTPVASKTTATQPMPTPTPSAPISSPTPPASQPTSTTPAPMTTPTPTPIPPGELFVDISSGRYHTCALRADGVPVCWGAAARETKPGSRLGRLRSGLSTGRTAVHLHQQWRRSHLRAPRRRIGRLLGQR